MNAHKRAFMEINLETRCQLKEDKNLFDVEKGIYLWCAKDNCVIGILKVSKPYAFL